MPEPWTPGRACAGNFRAAVQFMMDPTAVPYSVQRFLFFSNSLTRLFIPASHGHDMAFVSATPRV